MRRRNEKSFFPRKIGFGAKIYTLVNGFYTWEFSSQPETIFFILTSIVYLQKMMFCDHLNPHHRNSLKREHPQAFLKVSEVPTTPTPTPPRPHPIHSTNCYGFQNPLLILLFLCLWDHCLLTV